MKVLLVEDDKSAGNYLQKGLLETGYLVDWVQNGADGLHQALTDHYGLIILDIMLPILDGWQVLKAFRAVNTNTPVLLLTARDQVQDRVKGLELGADDYLIKPFAFIELTARIKALLRRGAGQATEATNAQITMADVEVDFVRHIVTRDGQKIDPTSQEFALLALFVRHPKEVLTRTTIASEVWDMNFDSDTNVVDVAIRRLRRKLDDPFERKLIHTVRSIGYLFDPEA